MWQVICIELPTPKLSPVILDADQMTGEDPSPHLRIKSEAKLLEEQCLHVELMPTGSNSMPLRGTSAKAPEYPNLDEDFTSLAPRTKVEEELNVEVMKHPGNSTMTSDDSLLPEPGLQAPLKNCDE